MVRGFRGSRWDTSGPSCLGLFGGLNAVSIRHSSSNNASACAHGADSWTFSTHYFRPSYPPSSRRSASRSSGAVPTSPSRRMRSQDARAQARYAKRPPTLLARSGAEEPPSTNECFDRVPANYLPPNTSDELAPQKVNQVLGRTRSETPRVSGDAIESMTRPH